ncbi:MAG: HAMP domain-containing protein [Alphaproteobacteria bacterium]|nr:HAMP domain-containing protein [Alphaproteobacteria bacterium]
MLVVLLPLIVYSTWEMGRRLEAERAAVEARLSDAAGTIAGELRSRIEAGRQVLVSLAQTEAVRGGDLAACSALMNRVVQRHPHVSAFSKVDETRHIVCSSDPLDAPVDVGWAVNIRDAFASGQFSLSPLYIGPTSGQPILVLTQPLLNAEGRVTGAIASGLTMTWLTDWLAAMPLPDGAEAVVFSGDGTVLARRPGGEAAIGQSLEDAELLTVARETGRGTAIVEGSGRAASLAGFSRLSGVPGELMIAVSQPRGSILARINAELARRTILLGFVVLLGFGTAAIGARFLVQRWIERLSDAAVRLGEGDLGARARPEEDRTEFGQLAAIYDRMADAVERREHAARLDLIEAKHEAERASQAKSRFVAHMSHELRTPLNAVIGLTEIMQMRLFGPVGNERYEGYVNDIHASGEHLLRTINTILDLSRIEAGRFELIVEEVDIVDVLRDALALVAPLAADKSVAMAIGAGTRSVSLSGDRNALKRVFLNIVSNAIKFTLAGGRVDIVVRRAGGDMVHVLVRDTGIGIPRDKLDLVLEPFEQVESGPLRSHEGTGLGLAIARKLIDLHGGRLTIDSELGRGTSVTVALPASV